MPCLQEPVLRRDEPVPGARVRVRVRVRRDERVPGAVRVRGRVRVRCEECVPRATHGTGGVGCAKALP